MIFFQFLANGISYGSLVALVAVGFSVIYRTTKIFHIVHGVIYTIASYFLYSLFVSLHLPLLLSLPLALGGGILTGYLVERFIYVPLVRREASGGIYFLSSLGVYIFLVNLIALIYGNEVKILSSGIEPTVNIGGVILTRIQIFQIFVSLLLFLLFFLFLNRTSWGKLIRAYADDPVLLETRGVNPYKVRAFVFCTGSFFASVASVLSSLDVGMDPHVGIGAFLHGAVATIIGGVEKVEGAVLGGYLLGILQSLVIWKTSARWAEAVTFGLLILFLLFKPEGLLGERRRVEE
ncbi:branched-chain amino acid ABC transporter permease [bacterium]|nr:MAG: branched-chain amino acid ABC transporter permease [bacterium]